MKPKYDQIGTNYNLTRRADPYLTEQLLSHLQPIQTGRYLDIGCGTGNYTHEFQKKGFSFLGIDPSELMLQEARRKNKQIEWRLGTAENTGLPPTSVDGIIASLTIHHWADLNAAVLELQRVLKRKGNIVIFTATPLQMKGYWLNYFFPKMLADAAKQMPSLEVVTTAMNTNGIQLLKTEPYYIQHDLKDQFLYSGKHNPELYFKPQIRNGISSFAALAKKTEVDQGLAQLREAIDSGAIDDIIKSYENDFGDYLFILGQKQ
ncbi:class I SAM-dependent methyltransferase [Croceitalea rosinachiae]|uniref:Class I SAM-dependent methyltransferase n=1 Tax=Croceitalea rosinachiae TaxID=3075596 RepID=A0ABU3A9J4_9FLAO|nr:class I SAM-dependent methyltransferase [Croceitalea sp. F388]MDT0606846.1 class I SAM-dependent methyltransferase [Croceitalea sp. F388]